MLLLHPLHACLQASQAETANSGEPCQLRSAVRKVSLRLARLETFGLALGNASRDPLWNGLWPELVRLGRALCRWMTSKHWRALFYAIFGFTSNLLYILRLATRMCRGTVHANTRHTGTLCWSCAIRAPDCIFPHACLSDPEGPGGGQPCRTCRKLQPILSKHTSPRKQELQGQERCHLRFGMFEPRFATSRFCVCIYI